jgi:predicted phosphodiesterase
MRLALISDIHANLEALTAVLGDIEKQKVDRILCLGDVIGYGSDPGPCLELVGGACEVRLMGNHESGALGTLSSDYYHTTARESADWTHRQMTDREMSMIAEYEMEHAFDSFHLVHSSPHEPGQWHYILRPEDAAKAFSRMKGQVCFFGHSHLPMIFAETEGGPPRVQVGHSFLPDHEGRYLVNVGSVGQPRDNDPRAAYVTFDDGEWEVTFHRIAYDVGTTQRKMAEAKLPQMLIDRLSVGR